MAIVRVSDLVNKISDLKKDNIEFVDLTIIDGEDDLQACISFQGIAKNSLLWIDYDEINTIDESSIS